MSDGGGIVPDEIVFQVERPIGAIIVNHSFVELTLDMCLQGVIDVAIREGILSKHPRRMGDKIRDLKRAGNKLPRLQAHRDLIAHACRGASRLNELRDILDHGVPIDYLEEGDPRLVFRRLRPDDGALRERQNVVSLKVLCEAANTAGAIVRDLQLIAKLANEVD